MLSRIQSLGSCLIVLTLLLFAGSASGAGRQPALRGGHGSRSGALQPVSALGRCLVCEA